MCNLSEGIFAEGIGVGFDKGAWSTAIKNAKNFLAMGLSVEKVAEGTELPLETVKEIAAGKAIEAYMDC